MARGSPTWEFILYDLFFKAQQDASRIYGIETREELVTKSTALAARLGFGRDVVSESVGRGFDRFGSPAARHRYRLPRCTPAITATDGRHSLRVAEAREIHRRGAVLPGGSAGVLKRNKGKSLGSALTEIWRHPLHTREFGSQITNVLRCLQLEAHGYQVSVTELVGWGAFDEKRNSSLPSSRICRVAGAAERLDEVIDTLGLTELAGAVFRRRVA